MALPYLDLTAGFVSPSDPCVLHRVIYLISLYCLSIIAARDHSTASLGNRLFSHLQNLAPKLWFFFKKRIPKKKWSKEKVGGETTHQLLSTRTQATLKIIFHVRTPLGKDTLFWSTQWPIFHQKARHQPHPFPATANLPLLSNTDRKGHGRAAATHLWPAQMQIQWTALCQQPRCKVISLN